MVFKLASVVTKWNPQTVHGREVISYPKADLGLIEAIALFKASPHCLPNNDYCVVEWPDSTHYSIHHLEKL